MKGRVTLFIKDVKEKQTSPDLEGKIVLDSGELVYINLWKEPTKAGGFIYKGFTKPAATTSVATQQAVPSNIKSEDF